MNNSKKLYWNSEDVIAQRSITNVRSVVLQRSTLKMKFVEWVIVRLEEQHVRKNSVYVSFRNLSFYFKTNKHSDIYCD